MTNIECQAVCIRTNTFILTAALNLNLNLLFGICQLTKDYCRVLVSALTKIPNQIKSNQI